MNTRTVQLEDVSDLVSKGSTPASIGFSYSKIGIPFLRAEDIHGGAVDLYDVTCRITPDIHASLRRSQLRSGDLLITIAGTLGRVGFVPATNAPINCNQAVAFVRLKPELVDLKYACYACQSPAVLGSLLNQQKVGTIGNLNLEQLRGLRLALPALSEQKRISGLLEQSDRLRRTRRYALELSDTFLPAAFLKLFGDPRKITKRWETEQLENLGRLDRGRSKHRPRNAPHLYGGIYPFIQTGDVANAKGYIRTHAQTYSEDGLKQSKLWATGTLCITIAANIGKTAILTYPACFPDSIVGFIPGERVKIEFVQFWLEFLQETLEKTAPEVAQKNINLEILRELRCPVPPLPLQQKFAELVGRRERLRAEQRESSRQSDHLFQSLLHRTFATGL